MSTTSTPNLKTRIERFVSHLHQLEKSDDGQARAEMAALRLGIREKNGVSVAMMPYVMKFLGPYEDIRRDPWFFVVAALFAIHPKPHGKGSFGNAFGRLRSESDSMEKRFQALLSCEETELFRHLIQAVSVLKAHDVPVNWYSLLEDLAITGWNHSDQNVQRKWARSFYSPLSSAPSADSNADTNSD